MPKESGSTPARRNRPYAPRMPPEDRYQQLLDVTLDVIVDDGVGAVSIDSVARRAGVTRPVAYRHFADTADLLWHSLNREEGRALTQLAAAAPDLSEPVGLAADARREWLIATLHHVLGTFLTATVEAPERWLAIYMIADSGTPAINKRVRKARWGFTEQLHRCLETARVFGDSVDLRLIALQLSASVWEFGYLALREPETYPHDRLMASLDDFVSVRIPMVAEDAG